MGTACLDLSALDIEVVFVDQTLLSQRGSYI